MCGAEAIIVADREGCRGDAARALGVAMFELAGGAGVAGQRWGLLWGASLQEDESEAHRLFAEVRGAPPPPRAAFAGHRALLMLDRWAASIAARDGEPRWRSEGWQLFPPIGRAHVCTPVTNAHSVCRLLLENKNILYYRTKT